MTTAKNDDRGPQMTDTADGGEVAYHLLLSPEEAAIAERALDLLIADEHREQGIRALARAVIEQLKAKPAAEAPAGPEAQPPGGVPEPGFATLTVPLTAPQMKITHTAVHLLLLDSSREQEDDRRLLWSILDKLPDEHALRAIELD
jgi:hypothetical protein